VDASYGGNPASRARPSSVSRARKLLRSTRGSSQGSPTPEPAQKELDSTLDMPKNSRVTETATSASKGLQVKATTDRNFGPVHT